MKLFPLFPAGVIAAALMSTACATPEGAIRARTELATLAQVEAKAAASEADAMAAKLVAMERAKVEAAKRAEYEAVLARISTPEQGAALGYNYALDMAAIDANAIAEAQRLGAVGAKIRVVGESARVLNQMADDEAKLASDTAALLWDEALPAAIEIAEKVQATLAAQEAARVAKLEADAKAAADAEARADDEPAEEEHTEPPAVAPVTPTAVTTGS